MLINTPLYHALISVSDTFIIENEIIKNRFEETDIKDAINNYRNIAIQEKDKITYYTNNKNKLDQFFDIANLTKINGNLKHDIIIKSTLSDDINISFN